MVALDTAMQMNEKKSSGQSVNDNKHTQKNANFKIENIYSQSLQLGVVGKVVILNHSEWIGVKIPFSRKKKKVSVLNQEFLFSLSLSTYNSVKKGRNSKASLAIFEILLYDIFLIEQQIEWTLRNILSFSLQSEFWGGKLIATTAGAVHSQVLKCRVQNVRNFLNQIACEVPVKIFEKKEN